MPEAPSESRFGSPDGNSSTDRHWHAFGVGFLVCALPAILTGLGETTFSLLAFRPSFSALLYGADVHLLLALISTLILRILFWRTPDTRFPRLALAGWLLAELLLVIPYWLITSRHAPPFSQTSGKLFIGTYLLVAVLIGLTLVIVAVRRQAGAFWQRLVWGRAGSIGLILALACLSLNLFLGVRSFPWGGGVPPRPVPYRTDAKDVIVILVDTLRRDHLSFFGYDRPTSPNIDRFMGESYVFSAAATPSTKTVPSVASIFTGLYPTSHGLVKPYQGLPEEAPTLAEHFRIHGYQTAAFVANLLVSQRQGFGQGFDSFFPGPAPWWSYQRRTAFELLARRWRTRGDATKAWRLNYECRKWMEAHPDGPRFLYLHYMEPHSTYSPPTNDLAAIASNVASSPVVPPLFHQYSDSEDCIDWECLDPGPEVSALDRATLTDRYDGEIRCIDRYVGQLLEFFGERGLLDQAHIVFMSDHGEQLGDHGGWFHGHAVYDELIGCPLAYRPPGGVAGGVLIERPVGQVDFMATLIDLLALPRPPLHQGREIPELLGKPAPTQIVPVLTERPPHLFALRYGPWKLIQRGRCDDPQWRLYHMPSDPGEIHDHAAAQPDTLAILCGYLQGYLDKYSQTRLDDVIALNPEALERLRSLGYIQ